MAEIFDLTPTHAEVPSQPPKRIEIPDGLAEPRPDLGQSKTEFDNILLADVPAQIAELVRSKGGVAGPDLAAMYESTYLVRVPAARQELLRRLAWSAGGRHFIERDEVNDLWLPGSAAPARIVQLGDWTVSRIRQRATDLLRAKPRTDPWEQIVGEVYRADGGRIPRVVMGIVGKLVSEVKRELKAN
jgi:hypothetical protein